MSALAYGAGHAGRALPRVAPGVRVGMGEKGPARVKDCMSTASESPAPAKREKVPEGRMRARERSEALLLILAVRAREQSSSLRSRPHPALRATFSRFAGEGLKVFHNAGYSAGFSTTRVLTATSSGIASVSAQSPPPTPKSRRFTVALPASTGAAPGVQVKVSVTGLLTPRSRSEEHTSELQSLMRISYAVFCLKKKNKHTQN